MKLVNSKYMLDMDLVENVVSVLVIENHEAMRSIVNDLWHQCNGEEGDFVLSSDKIKNIGKLADIVVNPFAVELNNRKVMNALYSQCASIANEYIEEKASINAQIIQVMDNVMQSEAYVGLDYSLEFAWTDMFKMYGLKISDDYDNFIEKMTEYIKVMSSLCNIEVFILVNMKQYLSESELNELYLTACYNKVHLIMIENFESKKNENEKMYIIDKDNCVILK